MKSKLLLTAFVPFGGESLNPAQEAVKRVRAEAHKLYLPVEYENAAKIALNAIESLKPRAVICVGQAGGRTGVTPEKYAVNLRNSASPDSAGRLCRNEKIAPDGPDRLETDFGAEKIVSALVKAGFKAYLSESAGTYVCNDVLYSVLSALRGTGVPAGFIHLPYCNEQLSNHPGAFGMDVDTMACALEKAIETVENSLDQIP